jgi:hypothetical protein
MKGKIVLDACNAAPARDGSIAEEVERDGIWITSEKYLPNTLMSWVAALASATTLMMVIAFQVVQRRMNFAISNPARQVFFTVVGRDEKYKAKNLIDVVVYRGSDALYGWVFDSLQGLGLSLTAIGLSHTHHRPDHKQER